MAGFEPATFELQAQCSTAELHQQSHLNWGQKRGKRGGAGATLLAHIAQLSSVEFLADGGSVVSSLASVRDCLDLISSPEVTKWWAGDRVKDVARP